MKRLVILLLLTFPLSPGCAKDDGQRSSLPAANAQGAVMTQPVTIGPCGDPSEVLVEVDGAKLPRGEVEIEVARTLSRIRGKVSPDRLKSVEEETRKGILERFVMKQLLLKEAGRRGLIVSEEEEKDALQKLQSALPEGTDLQDAVKSRLMTEKRLRSNIIAGIKVNKLVAQELTNGVTVTDEEISKFCGQHKQNLVLPESVKARHILISVPPNSSDETKAEKRKEAEDIRQQLLAGADFAETAKKYSNCPSRQMGGSLGTFRRGQMVKPFENAAFTQKPDTIGPVVETKFGYHVIQVLEHNEAGPMPRGDIAEMLRKRKRQKIVAGLVQSLKSKATIKYGPFPE